MSPLVLRSLTPQEARTLHEELKTTPNILGYTVRELLGFQEAFVAEAAGVFAGVCLSKDLRFGWTDIAALYVLPEFRGRGLGTELYQAAWRRAEERRRHIITLSRSPTVVSLMERSGMAVSPSMRRAPFAMHLYMQCHMTSLYRTREALRKFRAMRDAPPLRCGVKRFCPPDNREGD